MVPGRSQLLLSVVVLLLNASHCNRRYRKSKGIRAQLPKYEVYSSDTLPSDRQVTVFLRKDEPKIFLYTSSMDGGPLSTTITPCSSSVRWSIVFHRNNKTECEEVTSNIVTKSFTSQKGLYILKVLSQEKDTYLHIYISTERGGPAALQKASLQKLELFKRQRKRKITVKWKASLIDPQWTIYCLIISTNQSYKSLCSAESEKNHKSSTSLSTAAQTIISWQPRSETNKDPYIACVGKKTQYTVSNLKQGQTYFFSLFAVNVYSNLTYPFGSTSTQFDTKIQPISLKDGRTSSANLKKYDGKVVFKYKIGRKSGKTLNIYIVPCGTTVFAEVLINSKKVIPRRRIQKFDKIVIPLPSKIGRYYIKISTNNDDYLKRPSGVEVFATTKSLSQVPLPNMPSETTVKEYESLRQCHSVTIGWVPSQERKISEYCFVVREGRLQESDDFENINQCGLENRLKKSVDYVLQYCNEFSHNAAVLTERINHLKPGRYYIVQVTVKKPKGRSLSYDLVEVHTLPACDNTFLNTTYI